MVSGMPAAEATPSSADVVAFLGLGTMGGPMARQLVRAGYVVHVFDPDAAAVSAAVAFGARAAATPRAAAEASDIVICMLPHPDILREVLLGDGGVVHALPAPALVVDMSTSGPLAVRSCAQELAKRGIGMVDAPVGKGPWAAEKGDLTILLGGEEAACRRAEPVLRHIGSTVYYCGSLGSGQAVKLANNLVACATMAVVAEGYALCVQAGADPKVLLEMMPTTSADSWQLRHTLIEKIVQGDLSPMFKLKLAHKDLKLVDALASAQGTSVECASAAVKLYERAIQAGYGDLDWGAVALVVEPSLGRARGDSDKPSE